jgi:hypothetical protein
MAITPDRLAEIEEENAPPPAWYESQEFKDLPTADQHKLRYRVQKEFTPIEFQADDYPVHSGGAFTWNYNPNIELDPEDPVSQQQVETEFDLLLKAIPEIKPGTNPFSKLWDTGALSEPGKIQLESIFNYYQQHQQLPRDIHDFRKNIVTKDVAEGGPLYAAEGESLDRVAEIQEENLQDEENWGTKTAEFLLDMLPSEEKSWGENIFDAVTLAAPPLKVLKAAKVADPVLDTGIMQMAGRQYGKGFSKPGVTKIRGGSKQNTLKTLPAFPTAVLNQEN